MIRYPAGYRTSTYTAPTSSIAKGVWSLVEQLQAQKSGNWPSMGIDATYLIVAGGAGGAGGTGGGGGAGGAVSGSTLLHFGTTYTITVGAGGAGGNGTTRGSSGGDSSFTGLTTAQGGGGGGAGGSSSTAQGYGGNGGSGGSGIVIVRYLISAV